MVLLPQPSQITARRADLPAEAPIVGVRHHRLAAAGAIAFVTIERDDTAATEMLAWRWVLWPIPSETLLANRHEAPAIAMRHTVHDRVAQLPVRSTVRYSSLIAMAVHRFLPLPFFLGFPLCIGHASQVVARMQKFAIRAKDIALVDRGVSLNGRDDAAYLLFRDDLPGYDWEPLNDEFGEVSLIKKQHLKAGRRRDDGHHFRIPFFKPAVKVQFVYYILSVAYSPPLGGGVASNVGVQR